MASTGPGFVMGFGGGTHRGTGALPVNLDSMGNATMPLGRVTRSTSARLSALGHRHRQTTRLVLHGQQQLLLTQKEQFICFLRLKSVVGCV